MAIGVMALNNGVVMAQNSQYWRNKQWRNDNGSAYYYWLLLY